jgi:hypothetical protein
MIGKRFDTALNENHNIDDPEIGSLYSRDTVIYEG